MGAASGAVPFMFPEATWVTRRCQYEGKSVPGSGLVNYSPREHNKGYSVCTSHGGDGVGRTA